MVVPMADTADTAGEVALRQAMDAEAKRVIVDCTYSGRGHLEASHRWAGLSTWLGLPVVILSAVLASGAGALRATAAVASPAPARRCGPLPLHPDPPRAASSGRRERR